MSLAKTFCFGLIAMIGYRRSLGWIRTTTESRRHDLAQHHEPYHPDDILYDVLRASLLPTTSSGCCWIRLRARWGWRRGLNMNRKGGGCI
jgi:hypothetical protein